MKEQRHYMSITPKGTIRNLLERILLRGEGEEIEIADRKYDLREQGDLTKDDPRRIKIYKSIEDQIRLNPCFQIKLNIKVGSIEEKNKFDYKITLSRVDETPSNEEDKGNHEYTIIEGVLYKIKEEGNPQEIKSKSVFGRDQTRKMVLRDLAISGKLPDEVVLTFDSLK